MTMRQPNELRDSVLEFQELMALSIKERQQPIVVQQLERCFEHIWLLMSQDLLDLASQWLRSELGRNRITFEAFNDIKSSIALIALEGIYLRLQGIAIDTEKNLKGLLCTIARRTLIDENKKLRSKTVLNTRYFAANSSSKDTESSRMWKPLEVEKGGYKADEIADPSSFNWENDVIHSFSIKKQEKAIQLAISKLSEHDQLIIRLRYASRPPLNGDAQDQKTTLMPYKDIADILGENETTVRQRCSRALKKLRELLKHIDL